jgi:hypothetical protein
MATSGRTRTLRHGTTRQRAEAILKNGPDPNFKEPGGIDPARGFSTAPVLGPYPYGGPENCAQRKGKLFPNEGGPVVLELDVPEEIVALADDFGGEIRFSRGHGFEELLNAWPTLVKRIL